MDRPRKNIHNLQDIPNVGRAIEKKLLLWGIRGLGELIGRDPYKMFDHLCSLTGKGHDPCLLDTFISAVRFMEGGPPKKWWEFTRERKERLGSK